MKKKIGDLTIREIVKMTCKSFGSCDKCPFNDDQYTFKDKVCQLVECYYENEELEKEIEVEE